MSRIVLFSSGVGYFQRDGQVDGDSRIELHFPSQNINDLLKSLILQDMNGGLGVVRIVVVGGLVVVLEGFLTDVAGVVVVR